MASKSQLWAPKQARDYIYVPEAADNKYTHGVLGVVAGSKKYPGAAILAIKACAASGVGMIRFVGTPALNALVLNTTPSVVVSNGRVDAWLLGPGIEGRMDIDPSTLVRQRAMQVAYEDSVPTVLDAGGLAILEKKRKPILITPHAGELSQMLAGYDVKASAHQISTKPAKWAQIAHDTLGVTVLLKGSRTFVADSNALVELPLATPWLATAGTGDVLSGILGALVATHAKDLIEHPTQMVYIAATGALIHALAAQRASAGGPTSAERIIEQISATVADLVAIESAL
ncbi:MAG: NAD(P)H-hydrate dehydratase [Actinobacteria bacterium]|uniref:Unannotated protein n=1 Tax=freshwater metagenome TaxID=449393 RepID=A0A6J5YP03_9ZZZZ|nr:NAD(P)H-hydrate dehydratase [Actinomycetota bacterium]